MHRSALASALCLSLIAASAIPAASDPADAAMAAIRPEAIRAEYAVSSGQCPGRPAHRYARPRNRGKLIGYAFDRSASSQPATKERTFKVCPCVRPASTRRETTMSWTVAGKQQTLGVPSGFHRHARSGASG